jgi:hypothetical protein
VPIVSSHTGWFCGSIFPRRSSIPSTLIAAGKPALRVDLDGTYVATL